jgi:LCP family protein required for cell wall assembly
VQTEAVHGTGRAGRHRPPDEPQTGPAVPPQREARRRSALRHALVGTGALALVLAALLAGGFFLLENRYGGNIDRVSNVFAGLDNRPAPATAVQSAAEKPVTFLLMGSDTRAHPTSGTIPDGRSDVIMLVRFAGDRTHAQVVSIPRDSWVDIPGHGVNKINASYAFGGPSLLIETVEQLTGVRVDHFVTIDFDGISKVTDALGGVDVTVAQTTTNPPYTFQAGVNHLDGAEALMYLRQRYGLPGGDFDRERRHQEYLRSMFHKLFSAQTFSDPSKLDAALRAVTGSVTVDDTLSNSALLSLGLSMRNVTPENVQYLTAPVLGTGREGKASVVYLDMTKGARLWGYLKTDSLGENIGEFGAQQLTATPN